MESNKLTAQTLIADENHWIWTKSKPIGEWEWYKRVDCPDWIDINAIYEIIDLEKYNELYDEQEDWRKQQEPDVL